MMTLTLGHFLSLGAMLFALAVIGIFLNRKNLIVLLMASVRVFHLDGGCGRIRHCLGHPRVVVP